MELSGFAVAVFLSLRLEGGFGFWGAQLKWQQFRSNAPFPDDLFSIFL